MKLLFAVICLAACALGCAHHSSLAMPGPSIAARRGHVVLVRGFQDWYSTGIDELTHELTLAGIDAHAYPEDRWRDVAEMLAASSTDQPLVLIGFSYGADDVVAIARELHRPVDLLMAIDPVTPDAVPANVVRCVNFYQSNGPMDMLPWLRGIPLAREGTSSQPLQNIDIRQRPDLLEPNTSHATIAANRKVHAAMIELVRATCP